MYLHLQRGLFLCKSLLCQLHYSGTSWLQIYHKNSGDGTCFGDSRTILVLIHASESLSDVRFIVSVLKIAEEG